MQSKETEKTKYQKREPTQELTKLDPNTFTPLKEWQEILERINTEAPAIGAFYRTQWRALKVMFSKL